MGLLLAPVFLVIFWYRDFFLATLKKSFQIFTYTANLLSVPILLATFFKPLKNEYRDGLVIFSIGMGMIVKTALLLISTVILIAVIAVLIVINILVLFLPVIIIRFLI